MLLQLHEWGDPGAPPVVCVHGVNAHGRRFRRLAEERLADRYRVLAPDLRGHGGSEWDPPWTIATHVHDLLETVDDAGVRGADWVGHSFGGRLVLEWRLAARRSGCGHVNACSSGRFDTSEYASGTRRLQGWER